MSCVCGHSRSWHRVREVVRVVRRCQSWGCACGRFTTADEPGTRALGRGYGSPESGAVA